MKSKILCFILTIMSLTSIGQELTRADIVKHRIKSVMAVDEEGKVKSMDVFDENGNIQKSGTVDSIGAFELNREFKYDLSGRLMEEKVYNNGTELRSIVKYFYNAQSRLVRKENTDEDGGVESFWTYEYDNNGNKVRELQVSGLIGNSEAKYKYDSNARLLTEETTNNSIGKEEKVWYAYDEKGRLSKKKTKYYFGGATVVETYVYNAIGNILKRIEKSSSGVGIVTIYEYDRNGLLMNDTWQGSLSGKPYRTTYKIVTE